MKIFWILLLFLPAIAVAESFQSAFSGFGMQGINGSAGFGFANYQVKTPVSNFRMGQGVFVYAGAERQMGESPFFITVAFNYMTTSGQSFYDYTTLGGVRYQGTDIGFDSNNYQVGLGLKFKFFPSGWARPYVEGGGLFGYHEIKYSSGTQNIAITSGTGNAGDYKKKDGLTGLGYYGEGGLEVDFSEKFGVRSGVRYQETTTQPFETLGGQKVKFTTTIFQIAFLKKF